MSLDVTRFWNLDDAVRASAVATLAVSFMSLPPHSTVRRFFNGGSLTYSDCLNGGLFNVAVADNGAIVLFDSGHTRTRVRRDDYEWRGRAIVSLDTRTAAFWAVTRHTYKASLVVSDEDWEPTATEIAIMRTQAAMLYEQRQWLPPSRAIRKRVQAIRSGKPTTIACWSGYVHNLGAIAAGLVLIGERRRRRLVAPVCAFGRGIAGLTMPRRPSKPGTSVPPRPTDFR